MRGGTLLSAMLLCAVSSSASAQAPGPIGGAPPFAARGGDALENTADFLLAHTGELRLSDNQVTRLAAISRRAADRRRTVRDSLTALRPTGGPPVRARGDSAARAQRMQQRTQQAERMRPLMDRAREQATTDRRDAIATLTPEQQAQAWELVARGGRGAPFGPRFAMRGRGGGTPMRRMPGRGGDGGTRRGGPGDQDR